MLTTIYSSQNIRQNKLLKIALDLTSTQQDSSLNGCKKILVKQHQIWRDKDNIAIVNIKTQKLIIFCSTKFKSYPHRIKTEDIVNQTLWKNIQQQFPNIDLNISDLELSFSFEYLKPLDPSIKFLYHAKIGNEITRLG